MGERTGSSAAPARAGREPPTLVFVRETTSGPSRRMDSLIAWIRVTQKKRLRVIEVDAGAHPAAVARLGISEVPALVLVEGGRVLGKLEGRAKGKEIDALIELAFAPAPGEPSAEPAAAGCEPERRPKTGRTV